MTATVQEIVEYIEQQLILLAYLDKISGRSGIRRDREIAYKEILEFIKTGETKAAFKKAALTALEGCTNEKNHLEAALERRSDGNK
jgi:hypothetical protein